VCPCLNCYSLSKSFTATAVGAAQGMDRYTHGTNDWIRYILSQKLAHEPGEKFVYSNSTFYLLSCIVHRVSGMTTDKFLRKHLFTSMGIESFAWEACPMGETFGASSLYMGTKDIAKLGVLYLNKGEYAGKRLLSRGFAEDAVKPYSGDPNGPGYGYSFWLNDIGYNGGGAYNQIILVVPQKDIVFAAHSFIEKDFDFVSIVKEAIG
jgi:CubicO group peptidase (beta-lactamase class C family)